MIPHVPPRFGLEAFNCPHCGAYANQSWRNMFYYVPPGNFQPVETLKLAHCVHCSKATIWLEKDIIFPEASGIEPANPDLRDDIQTDYREAASIVSRSPRGAAALLRLCVQKLCAQLGEGGENLNSDIANLVKRGLSPKIKQALDVVRVIGNNAVHPGQIDLRDDRDAATQLFKLVNLVAEVMITQPKEIEKLYESLPESARDAIQRRDESDADSGR